jgi:hypothetical protein
LGCLGSPPWSRYATYQPNPSGDHGDIVGIECLFHGILDWIEINSAMPSWMVKLQGWYMGALVIHCTFWEGSKVLRNRVLEAPVTNSIPLIII